MSIPQSEDSDSAPAFDTDVLVVGTGPTGATAALALATYGVRVRVVTKRNWLANSPRAHITNQRALEVLRDLDVEAEASLHGTPWDLMGETLFTTSLAGEEVARLRTWGTGESRASDYRVGSPCPMLDIPQPLLESVLVRNAAVRGAQVAFNTEYLSHSQDGAGVTVSLKDRLTGNVYAVRSRYLIGADGAQSQIVAELGLPIEGTMGRAASIYTQFRADLTRYVEHRPSVLYWIMTPGAGYGEIGMGTLRAVRPWTEWIAGWGYDLSQGEPDLSADAVLPRIREMIGDPDVEIDIEKVTTWQINQAWATTYSDGRVFCAGDAVHRHPPSSGLGSNTSMQDAFNLAWKLAYVVKGWAGVDVLRSYSVERAPIGAQVVARANQSRVDYGPINSVFRTVGEADPVAAGLAKLRDPGQLGVDARIELGVALELKNAEFNAQGTEMNQRYSSGAVLADTGVPMETWSRDRGLFLQASTRPGAKLPHAWLVDRHGHKISTLDVVGRGRFTAVTGLSGGVWADAVVKLDLPFLRVVVIGAPGFVDSYGDWARQREVEESGVLLARPDGYIGWREQVAVVNVTAAMDRLLAAIGSILAHHASAD